MANPEYPTNFKFHQGTWPPVTIRGSVPVSGYLAGHETEIISADNGYGHPTPPPGMVLVLTDLGLRSVHCSLIEERVE